jgi:NAD(P)-dependent dehydrogenase (short-subunit alcohol dehydrogenase family)
VGGTENVDLGNAGRHDVGPAPGSAGAPPDGRVALVTGGNRGQGLTVVRRLAELGMRVVLGSASAEHGRLAIDRLGGLADRVAVRELDVVDQASISRLTSWLDHRLGRCDVLVNGVDAHGGVEANLLGAWRLTHAIAPLMRALRYGRVVNMSNGLVGAATIRQGLAAHRLTRIGVNVLTTMLSDELGEDGILVNAFCPRPLAVPAGGRRSLARLSGSVEPVVFLATLPDDGPTGRVYRGRMAITWRPSPWGHTAPSRRH